MACSFPTKGQCRPLIDISSPLWNLHVFTCLLAKCAFVHSNTMEAIKGTQFFLSVQLKRIRAMGQLLIFSHVSEAYPGLVRTLW